MKSIGIFEAKTKLSQLCAEVAESREPYVITRRGQPIVQISPLSTKDRPASVWELREQDEQLYGVWTEELEIPARDVDSRAYRNPLDDE